MQPIAFRPTAACPGAECVSWTSASRTWDCTPYAAPMGARRARCSAVLLRTGLCASAQQPCSAGSCSEQLSCSQALRRSHRQSLSAMRTPPQRLRGSTRGNDCCLERTARRPRQCGGLVARVARGWLRPAWVSAGVAVGHRGPSRRAAAAAKGSRSGCLPGQSQTL